MSKIKTRNPFVFPAGRKPGFDPGHVATGYFLKSRKGITNGPFSFSFVATSDGNMLDVWTGKLTTRVGSPTSIIDGLQGPTVNTSNTNYLTYSNDISGNLAGLTIAAIGSSIGSAFSTLVAAGGLLRVDNNNTLAFVIPNVIDDNSGIPIVGSHPYFLVASYSQGKGVSFAATDLANGRIYSAFVTDTLKNTGYFGTITLGTDDTHSFPAKNIAAAACFAAAMPLPDLLRWAADPWFWYPDA